MAQRSPRGRDGAFPIVSATLGRLTVSPRGRTIWDRFLQAGGQLPEDDVPSLIAITDSDTAH